MLTSPKLKTTLPMTQHPTREAWLLSAIELLKPLFAAKGFAVPVCQVSCGFASSGTRNGHIGQCWSTKSSANALNHIFISPTLGSAFDVIDTLVHELVHAVDNCEHKHGREFKRSPSKSGWSAPCAAPALGRSSRPSSPPS